ncbi:MAG: HAD hydrolase-like protein, partial [Oscillospiraceae bacterium]|nr:HAD hydrolase-like protein [Oscillospiraceae bacterium]
LLEKLKAMGKRICLATCKPDVASEKILQHFGIDGFFDFVGAATLDGKRRTKADVLRFVLENTGADVSDCVLVGDRMHDIIGAHEVGMKCIGVLVGFGSREEFSEYGADHVAEKLCDVLKFV